MSRRPNILFLMTDQMQARVLDPGHPCKTPNLDRVAARGVRIENAYTPNAVCSPARASLMTGLLPHTHGVLHVSQTVDYDQAALRRDSARRRHRPGEVTGYPHFAECLRQVGYRTGYFGKWHVEHSDSPEEFGWEQVATTKSEAWRQRAEKLNAEAPAVRTYKERRIIGPPGYPSEVFYAVNSREPAHRPVGIATSFAAEFLESRVRSEEPWCCFVSCPEPHDPFVCGRRAYDLYDPDSLPVPPNWEDDLAGRPNLYRKSARVFSELSMSERREIAACYYGMISEIDEQYGRLIDLLEERNELDNTIIVFTSDHGELLGAHGLYQKNIGAFEEVYNISMIVAAAGMTEGRTSRARVGLHELAPTLCELCDAPWHDNRQSRSFASLLAHPDKHDDRTDGYAEYFGTRYSITQRIVWHGRWKLVWNGFDFDELYDLADDPWELRNRIDDPDRQSIVQDLMAQAWRICRETNDHTLYRANYPSLRLSPYGPEVSMADVAGDHTVPDMSGT